MGRRFFPALAVSAAVIAVCASPAFAAATEVCHTAPPCTSAVCVYVEQVPTSGACHHKKPVHHSSAPSTSETTQTQTTSTQTTSTPPVAPTKKPQTTVKHPANRKPVTKPVVTVHVVKTSAPSAVSAAFDLGFGPTALFAALLAVAALLALGGGLRHGRRR